MRSHRRLYESVISFQNLLRAARLSRRGKRLKKSTLRFDFQMERELWRLHEELRTKSFRPGAYRHFTVYEPKRRIISAAPYRDRIVHHALHNVLEPIFDPTLIHDSYATRLGKGTYAALDRFQGFAQKHPYVLKCDVRKYFPSVDHDVLRGLLRRKIACSDTLWLVDRILESHRPGIPIGNLTSQFFANVYLNGLDHHLKEKWGCRYYIRYMDDFAVFHEDKEFLWRIREAAQNYLKTLKLSIHEDKSKVFKTSEGVPFLGMTIFPSRRRMKRQNVVRFKRRLRWFQERHREGVVVWSHIHQSVQSWIGHASHADTFRLREDILKEVVF